VTEPVPVHMLWLAAGFVLWSSAFIALYGIQAVGCAYDWPLVLHRAALGLVLVAHLAALGLLIAKAPRERERQFLADVTVWTLWAALAATVLTYSPALALTACL
jgi:hypothetical protein